MMSNNDAVSIWRPHNGLNSIQRMPALLDNFFDYLLQPETDNQWTPNLDISSDNQNYYLKLDLPGIEKDNMGISWDDKEKILSISGERSIEKSAKTPTDKTNEPVTHRSERYYGKFVRALRLADGNGENVTANMKNGVLSVTVPKIAEPTPKKIEINIE